MHDEMPNNTSRICVAGARAGCLLSLQLLVTLDRRWPRPKRQPSAVLQGGASRLQPCVHSAAQESTRQVQDQKKLAELTQSIAGRIAKEVCPTLQIGVESSSSGGSCLICTAGCVSSNRHSLWRHFRVSGMHSRVCFA